MSVIEVGNARCDKGEKRFGELALAEDSLSGIEIPVGIINGSEDGPCICIVAGTHACEYVGIDTAVKMYHDTTPDKIRGSLIILPVINPAAFRTVTAYVNPMDDLNMAFMYTGSKDTTTTERMCTAVLENAVFKSNYVLDLHGGDIGEIMLPSVIASVTNTRGVDESAMNLARAFGTKYVIRHKPGEGPTTAAKYTYESTLEAQAARKGIPGIVGEIGANGQSTPEDVEYYFGRVQNVLRYLGVTDGKLDLPKKQKLISGSRRLRASRGGIFRPLINVGDYVKQETVVGIVTDLKGDERERLQAPVDGLVTIMFTRHVVDSGQIVMGLTTSLEELPPWDPYKS